jgi:hypothetical protein
MIAGQAPSPSDSSGPPVDLSTKSVIAALMEEPVLYALASTLGRVEHWVYDRDKPNHPSASEREVALARASAVLTRVVPKLEPEMVVIEFFVGLSSERRFQMLGYFDARNPNLTPAMTEFAFGRRKISKACGQLINWLDVIQKSHQIRRVFSEANAEAVIAVLSRLPKRPV